MANEQKSLFDRCIAAWWGKAGMGIFLVAGAYKVFYDFTRLEVGEIEKLRGNKLLLGVYDLVGKWPPTLALAAIGIVFIAWGAKQLATGED